MIITKPAYFDTFRCIASACPDSCCKEWAVQVDDEAARYYRALPGPLGDRLRQVLTEEDGETVMQIEDGRCPLWRADGLCRIQAELGEGALCATCRDFPRLRHDYGDFAELGLELSCPEAARILLTAPAGPWIPEEVPGGSQPDYDAEAMAVLKATREEMLAILADESRSVNTALALGLLYGCQAQAELDGAEALPFDPAAALAEARELAAGAQPEPVLPFFAGLEILTEDWARILRAPAPGGWEEAYRNLARYFVERYWLQAVSDYDLYSRVKFMVISCLAIREAGGDLQRTAQLYSKEIENDADNVDALLDAAYTHPAFTDDKLLAALLR